MKARHRSARALAGLAIGLAVVGAPAEGSAQGMNRQPDPNAPRIMVPALRGSEKNVGVQAADAIRSRLNQDVPFKQLYVLPKGDIVAMLEASGYDPNQPLPPNDAKELAKLLRADEYLEGNVTKTPTGFRIESRLVLARDNSLVQPLPVVEGARLDVASKSLSAEIQNARKQLESERACLNLAREGKFKEAATAAQAGITAYPQSTLARNCIMQAYVRLQYPSDSILRVAQEIIAVYPRFRPALQLAARAYKEKGDTARMVTTYGELLAANPGDANLVELIVSELASSGQAQKAIPIIDQAVTENPGDTRLLDLQFRLKYVAKDWKGAVGAAEEIAKLDTAMMDTTYFARFASAYLNDSMPQKAVEVMSRATQKFTQHAGSWLFLGQTQRAAGQLDQAVGSVQRAKSIDPLTEGADATIIALLIDQKKADSAFTVLRTSAFAPDAAQCAATAADSTKQEWKDGCKKKFDNRTFLGAYALKTGNDLYRAANVSKAVPEFQTAIRWLALSDSIAPTDQAKFLQGATNVSMAQALLQEVQKSKSCDPARAANNALVEAQPQVMRGGKFAPQAAGQLIQAIQQLQPYAEQASKAYCK